MGKISMQPNNNFCPQTLFLYGTYDEKGDGEVMLCKIRNVLQDESLSSDETIEQKLARVAPVRTIPNAYFAHDGKYIGAWGEPMKKLK